MPMKIMPRSDKRALLKIRLFIESRSLNAPLISFHIDGDN